MTDLHKKRVYKKILCVMIRDRNHNCIKFEVWDG